MSKTKIEITQSNGESMVQECDAAYGCCMTRVMGEEGLGISCMSYLTGEGIPVMHAAESMAASIVKVIEKLTEGNPDLEKFMLSVINENIIRRMEQICPEKGEEYAGN